MIAALVASLFGIAAAGPAALAAAGDITTVAADLAAPWGIEEHAGELFVTENQANTLVRIDASGVVTPIAGGGAPLADGGPAAEGVLNRPESVAVDAEGNVYISDTNNNRIRRVDADTGIITTVAGTGEAGFSGDGGPATDAQLSYPADIAVDAEGNLYISDPGNGRIRRVDADTGIITTYAGGGTPADGVGDGGLATDAQLEAVRGLVVDAEGNLFISDVGASRIRRVDADTGIITTVAGNGTSEFSGDGGPATEAGLSCPEGIAVDAEGNLYIATLCDARVRRVDADTGIITTYAGTDMPGFSGDGGPATEAQLGGPFYLAVGPDGNLYIPDIGNSRVRMVDADTGIITTVAGTGEFGFGGDGGPATEADLYSPQGVAFDAAGNLLIADTQNNRIRLVDADTGIITTFAGGGVGDNGPAADALLSGPRGVAVDASGNVFIADCGNDRVRRVDVSSGVITTVAGGGLAPLGGLGDGGPATEAGLECPSGVALDAAGNLYIADTDNHRVRRVDPSGTITTVAGDGTTGFGANGVPATTTSLTLPTGVALDEGGSLYIAESGFSRIRKVDATTGVITTLAGTGIPGFSGDGGPATTATVNLPTHLDLDAAGNVFFTDRGNGRVRKVEPGAAPSPTEGCGLVVTANLTLTEDIGPCAGDGIVVGADNITINLNGHRVFGTPETGEGVGIRITGHQGVTVTGGTSRSRRQGGGSVTNFDAGVAIVGGSGNTISGLRVQDNIGPNDSSATFGDGIAMFFSSDNRILNNIVAHNGVFDGIGVLGQGSDRNLIQGNSVGTTFVGDSFIGGVGILMNPFLSINLPRGVSLYDNRVVGNTVSRNDNSGISTLSNIGGEISDNRVENNGKRTTFPANGIGVRNLFFAEPVTSVLVQRNQVHGNFGNGIEVGSQGNQVLDNNAANNGDIDLIDFNENCDDNVWSGNIWGSGGFFPECVTSGGHPAGTTTPAAGVPAALAASESTAPSSEAARSGAPLPEREDPPPRGHPPMPE